MAKVRGAGQGGARSGGYGRPPLSYRELTNQLDRAAEAKTQQARIASTFNDRRAPGG